MNGADGLSMGQCHLGDHKSYGLTRSEYRTAKDILKNRKHIEIIETCRTRKNLSATPSHEHRQTLTTDTTTEMTTGLTTIGTLVQLCSSSVYDINIDLKNNHVDDPNNHPDRHRIATGSPPNRHEQERKKVKKRKKEEISPTPFFSISEIKCFFGEFVSLTKEQHSSLLSKHGEQFVEHMIDVLDAYKGSKHGSKEEKIALYGCDYAVMKKGGWVEKRTREDLSKDKSLENKKFGSAPQDRRTKGIDGKPISSASEGKF
jgi:hypothetical protein